MEFVKKHKNNIMVFCGILVFSVIICCNFIQKHYATDTYVLMSGGYTPYIDRFLASSRPISAMALFLARTFHMSYNTYIILMDIMGIIALSLAVFALYLTVVKLLKKENGKEHFFLHVIVVLIAFFTIFNFCTIEELLFAESAVMCMGVLFSVLGASCFATDKKYRYLLGLLFLSIAGLCHQGTLTLFIPLALLFVSYKHGEDWKKGIKEILFVLLTYALAYLINFIFIKLMQKMLQMEEVRPILIPSIKYIIDTFLHYIPIMCNGSFMLIPKYVVMIVTAIISVGTIVYMILEKKEYLSILYYFMIIAACILLPILPLIIMSPEAQYLEPRMAISYGAMIGIVLLFFIIHTKVLENNVMKNVLLIFSVLIFTYTCIFYVQKSSQHIATNKLDQNFAEIIIGQIKKYENQTGNSVNKIGILFDDTKKFIYSGLPETGPLTQKALAVDWSIKEVIEAYSGKVIEKIEIPIEIEKQFEGKNWDYYDEEQLLFVEDTLYICVY